MEREKQRFVEDERGYLWSESVYNHLSADKLPLPCHRHIMPHTQHCVKVSFCILPLLTTQSSTGVSRGVCNAGDQSAPCHNPQPDRTVQLIAGVDVAECKCHLQVIWVGGTNAC